MLIGVVARRDGGFGDPGALECGRRGADRRDLPPSNPWPLTEHPVPQGSARLGSPLRPGQAVEEGRMGVNGNSHHSLQFVEESEEVTMALGTAWKQMSWLYYQYLLVTALYMLEPWERTIFNSLLISIVGMAVYTGYVFMPQHIMAILHYFEIVQ